MYTNIIYLYHFLHKKQTNLIQACKIVNISPQNVEHIYTKVRKQYD